ncbi:hypothetical protein Tco_0534678 [Tanacetum coccineum]
MENDADVDNFKRCRTSYTFDDGYRVLRDLILHRSSINNSASLSNKFGGLYFSFKFGILGLLHHVVTTIADRIRELLEYMDVHDNDASESSQPSWGKIVYVGEVVYSTSLSIVSVKYSAYVRRIIADFLHVPLNEYSPRPNDNKDTEDPSWSTSFKTRRTQETSSALEELWKTLFVVFVLVRNIDTPLILEQQSHRKHSWLCHMLARGIEANGLAPNSQQSTCITYLISQGQVPIGATRIGACVNFILRVSNAFDAFLRKDKRSFFSKLQDWCLHTFRGILSNGKGKMGEKTSSNAEIIMKTSWFSQIISYERLNLTPLRTCPPRLVIHVLGHSVHGETFIKDVCSSRKVLPKIREPVIWQRRNVRIRQVQVSFGFWSKLVGPPKETPGAGGTGAWVSCELESQGLINLGLGGLWTRILDMVTIYVTSVAGQLLVRMPPPPSYKYCSTSVKGRGAGVGFFIRRIIALTISLAATSDETVGVEESYLTLETIGLACD